MPKQSRLASTLTWPRLCSDPAPLQSVQRKFERSEVSGVASPSPHVHQGQEGGKAFDSGVFCTSIPNHDNVTATDADGSFSADCAVFVKRFAKLGGFETFCPFFQDYTSRGVLCTRPSSPALH